jgi:Sugar (and other) transporter.
MAASASTCTNWINNFAVVMFTPVFSNQSSWGLYLFFALVNFTAIPFAYFFYVETAGRDLEEIDVIFAKAHVEKKWPFQIAQELPKLSVEQISQMQIDLGLVTTDNHAIDSEKVEIATSSGESENKREL